MPLNIAIKHDDKADKSVIRIDGAKIYEGELNLEKENLLALGAQLGSAITSEKLDV